jgi:hypothetical protein
VIVLQKETQQEVVVQLYEERWKVSMKRKTTTLKEEEASVHYERFSY